MFFSHKEIQYTVCANLINIILPSGIQVLNLIRLYLCSNNFAIRGFTQDILYLSTFTSDKELFL